MVTIFRFELYNPISDQTRVSSRWGTKEGIARIGGVPIESTAFDIADETVEFELRGLTKRGFEPKKAVI